jgi:hypothetical protein
MKNPRASRFHEAFPCLSVLRIQACRAPDCIQKLVGVEIREAEAAASPYSGYTA